MKLRLDSRGEIIKRALLGDKVSYKSILEKNDGNKKVGSRRLR